MHRMRLLIAVLAGFILGVAFFALYQIGGHTHRGSSGDIGVYTCPMHPQIIRETPGDCPLCGMALVPAKKKNSEGGVPAHAIWVDPAFRQSIGVRVVTARMDSLISEVVLSGTIEPDPARVVALSARVTGWIEELRVRFPGERVRAGQILALWYSPELFALQEEFLQARSWGNDVLAEALRGRLRASGMDSVSLASLERSGVAQRRLPWRSPIDGIVSQVNGVVGQYLMTGQELYRLVDLSRVWVSARVFSEDLSGIHPGLDARVEFPQQPEYGALRARLSWVSPLLQEPERSARLGIALFNTADIRYRPGMVADVRIRRNLGVGVVIPRQSVVRSGRRAVAILALGNGYYEPREVELGAEAGEWVLVLRGIAAGDSLVTSAQYLIDAESHLQTALSKIGDAHDRADH